MRAAPERRSDDDERMNEGGNMATETLTEKPETDALVAPHGGVLVDRFVPRFDVERFLWRALNLPRLVLTAKELADLELIATGAASPLTGFLVSKDYESVLERSRLHSGLVWPVPLTLAVDEEAGASLVEHAEAALADESGRVWGTIAIENVFRRDNRREARLVFGTEDPAHPGVRDLLSRPEWLVGGAVRVLPLPELPFERYRLTPRRLREEIAKNGWRTVAGFQTRNPIHRAHEHLTKLALEYVDGLVLHPLVGETKSDDVPAEVRFKVYETLLDRFYPKERTLLAAFPAAMRYAGPREALFHALVRKNYGITHFIVGRDHAGVGSFYPPRASQEVFDGFTTEELGITPLRFEPAFWCAACGSLASAKTCPHGKEHRLELSGSKVRALLSEGKDLPREFSRPETVAILREWYRRGESRVESRKSKVERRGTGFIVWFTGLSGAGKSTLARALEKVLEETIPVAVLDGDEVRTSLCKDLGFSREDRDANVERLGFVARTVAKTGAAALVAAISPYRASRDRARTLAEADGIPFLEVFVHAPLEVLAARDPKGLYKKALAGEIARFTGVSDPYEEPVAPELATSSAGEPVSASLARILDLLEARGLVRLREERVA
jgi:sulfate adenylyltransferase